MFCVRCQHDIIDCTCPDIQERLASLADHPVIGLAAKRNLQVRKAMHPDSSGGKEVNH